MMRGLDAVSARRGRGFQTFVVIALALISLFFSLNALTTRAWSVPGDFGIEGLDSRLRIVAVDPGSAAAGAGIHAGDRVDLSGMPLDERGYLFDDLPTSVGAKMTLRVVHDGQLRSVVLVARPGRPWAFSPDANGLSGGWIFLWSALLVAALFVISGAVIVLVRPCVMTWGFYLYCLGVHPFMPMRQLEPLWLGTAFICVFLMLYALGYAGLIVFAARFPNDRAAGGWLYFERAAVPIFAVQLGINLFYWSSLITASPMPDLELARAIIVATVYAGVFVALCVKLLALKRSERASVSWIVVGFGVGCVLGRYVMGFYPGFGTNAAPGWAFLAKLATTAVFPLSVAYAVIRHRALELGFFANRLLVYAFFGAAAALLFGVLDWLLSTHLALSTFAIGVGIALALVLGMFLQAHHNRAVRLIDRFFLPQRYEAAVSIDRIRESVRRDAEKPHEIITKEVAMALDLASVAVFRRADDGGFVREASSGWSDGTVWHLLPDDTLTRILTSGTRVIALPKFDSQDVALPAAAAHPLVALALRRSGRVEGAILVGPHRNGSGVDRDEVLGLAALFGDLLAA